MKCNFVLRLDGIKEMFCGPSEDSHQCLLCDFKRLNTGDIVLFQQYNIIFYQSGDFVSAE